MFNILIFSSNEKIQRLPEAARNIRDCLQCRGKLQLCEACRIIYIPVVNTCSKVYFDLLASYLAPNKCISIDVYSRQQLQLNSKTQYRVATGSPYHD